MSQDRTDGVIVSDEDDNVTNGQLIVDLAEAARLPAIYPYREHFEVGGFLVYGGSLGDIWRRMAGYVARILGVPSRATFRSTLSPSSSC
jgi:putative tryptophan/tyrosine transport system substrate-binding protein